LEVKPWVALHAVDSLCVVACLCLIFNIIATEYPSVEWIMWIFFLNRMVGGGFYTERDHKRRLF
jgi:hypothetical protein